MIDILQLRYVKDLLAALSAIIAFGIQFASLIYKLYEGVKGRGYKQALQLIDGSQMAKDSKDKVKKTMKSMRRVNHALLIVLAVMGFVSALIVWYEPTDHAALSRYLSRYDPSVFSYSRSKLYDIARVIPDRESLISETDFGATLDRTTDSFDLVARHAGSIVGNFKIHILNALDRGVRIRVIVCDPGETNTKALDFHAEATGRPPDRVRGRINESLQELAKLKRELGESKKEQFQVRLFQGTLLHSMWIKDADLESAVAHLGMYFHWQTDFWPSFRASRKTSARMTENAASEFTAIWNKGVAWKY